MMKEIMIMGKDLKYFMRKQNDVVAEVPAPESMRGEDGVLPMMKIRKLTMERVQQINELYHTRRIATDKKGKPYVVNGEVVHEVKRDNARAGRHLVAEALVFPNLNDEELKNFYNCVDLTEMPLKVFYNTDEYSYVSEQVMKVLGFGPETEEDGAEGTDKEIEDAKN